MKTAKSWKVKIKGEERSIELFDENGEKIVGAARWEGNFDCSHQNLTSLEGAPQEVGGGFFCDNNKLTSLEDAPKEVGIYFNCSNNKLTSLEGAPKEIGGYFDCSYNNLTSLEGAPQEVGGHFCCSHNKLASLKGAPKEVGGGFYCYSNKLTSLEGAPKQNSKNVIQTLFIKHLKRSYVYYDHQIVKLSQFYKYEHDYPKEFVEKVKLSLRQMNFEEQLREIIK